MLLLNFVNATDRMTDQLSDRSETALLDQRDWRDWRKAPINKPVT